MCKLMQNASNKWPKLHINFSIKLFLSKPIWQYLENKRASAVFFSRCSACAAHSSQHPENTTWNDCLSSNTQPSRVFAFTAETQSNADKQRSLWLKYNTDSGWRVRSHVAPVTNPKEANGKVAETSSWHKLEQSRPWRRPEKLKLPLTLASAASVCPQAADSWDYQLSTSSHISSAHLWTTVRHSRNTPKPKSKTILLKPSLQRVRSFFKTADTDKCWVFPTKEV